MSNKQLGDTAPLIVLNHRGLTVDSAHHRSDQIPRAIEHRILHRNPVSRSLFLSTVTLMFVLLINPVAAADSTTYGCEEKTNYKISKVGVYSGNAVVVDEDWDDRACRFAVNGANVESPNQATVIAAINSIRGGQIRNLDNAENQRHLAFLTISASPTRQPPSDLLELFRRHHRTIESCFTGSSGDGAHNGFSFSCRTFSRGTRNPYHTRVRLPTLEIVVNYPQNRRRTRTYIPFHIIGDGRLLPLNLR